MKIIVFSDSHGSYKNMMKAIELHIHDISAVIHLGDGTKDMEFIRGMYPDLLYCCVSGNYEDWASSSGTHTPVSHETVLDFNGKKFFLTHGHKYNVKFGYERIIANAESRGCDIVLFGHTHVPEDISLYAGSDGRILKLFNPGSISFLNPSYGVVHIVNGVIVTSVAKI